jgi:hypothetical protein
VSDRFRDFAVQVDVSAADKLRLKEFMRQELHYYNAMVEGLGPRARTFPETLIAIHKDWEALWECLALHSLPVKLYERAAPDAKLPEVLEPHRRMLLGKDVNGRRFLDERMLNIMSIASTPAVIHGHVRRNMARLMLEFYKEQAIKLSRRNDDAVGEEDLYSKPIDLLVKQDMVCKRHLQVPRSALNDVRWLADQEVTELYHPYSENPLRIPGKDLESNNHWNQITIHQQPGVEAIQTTPWVVDIRYSQDAYQIRYQDMDRPTTGRIFATMKRRSF